MNAFLQDLRQVVRTLGRAPGFVLVSMVTLGIAIGANTAVYSAIRAVLVQPLPVPELDQLVVLRENVPELGATNWPLAPGEVVDLRDRQDLFRSMAGILQQEMTLTGAGEPLRLGAALTFGDLFDLLHVQPLLGRLYTHQHSVDGPSDVVVLSHGLWQRLTGGDPDVVGRTLSLDGLPHEVIGVLPPEARFPRRAEIYVPVELPSDVRNLRSQNIVLAVARLRPEIDPESLARALEVQGAAWNEEYRGMTPAKELVAIPLVEFMAGPLRLILMVLMAAVSLVLLIACANVASLQLVRAAARTHDLAMRAALGASRARIASQVLMESAVVALGGGALGIGVAVVVLDLLGRWDPTRRHALEGLGLDLSVLAFAAGAALAAAAASGALPALRASAATPQAALRASPNASPDRSRHGLLRGSVAVQIALALVLLLSSGLMVRSLTSLLATDPGFAPDRLITARLALPTSRYDTASRQAFFDALLERLQHMPGIEQAALGSEPPFSGRFADSGAIELPGVSGAGGGEPPLHAEYRMVSEGYFRTLGIPLLAGRTFGEEARPDSPLVVVVDQRFAQQFFPGRDPLGAEVTQFGQTAQIVGVVGSVAHGELGEASGPLIYYLHRQLQWSTSQGLIVRTALDATTAIELLRGVVRELDPELPLHDAATMEQGIQRSLGDRHLTMAALGTFAGVALLLAVMGVYGVMRYSTDQRAREVGVRLALGARDTDVLRMIMLQSLAVTLVGVGLGLGAGLALTRLMEGLLHDVGPRDPVVFVAVPALLALAAMLAAYAPARRAARSDPMSVLREQ